MTSSEWINSIGGLTGFISALYVLIERLSRKAKIKVEVVNPRFFTYEPSRSDDLYHYNFGYRLEIGNIGNEHTTLMSAHLTVKELDWQFECRFSDKFSLTDNSKVFLVLPPGSASVYKLEQSDRKKEKPELNAYTGTLVLRFLTGKNIKIKVMFPNETKS